jgi:glutamine synthetase
VDVASLRSAVDDGEIHTVVTAIPDLYGRLVGKRITGHFFVDEVAEDGMHVCDYLLACDMEMDPTPGYDFASWKTGYGDLHATPVWSTLRRAEWLEGTAIVLCDCFRGDPEVPVEVAPRTILRRQLDRLAVQGISAQMGSELEFFLFRDDYRKARKKGYRDLRTHGDYVEDYHLLAGTFAEDVVGEIRHRMDASGIPVEFSKGEWGPGQHEINLRYAPAMEMADRHVIYKQAAKEIAAGRGKSLTFMAKWDERHAGSSMHVHTSLWGRDGEALFPGSDGPSDVFRHALGGMLAHARELTLLFAPTVNSYKRYQAGTFAPTGLAWSFDNRTAGFRIVGDGPSLRIECRVPGADANPYLAFAGLLAAAIEGIESALDPGPGFEGDVYAAADLPRIPTSMAQAIAAFEASAFARKAFGDEVVDHLLHFAKSELAAVERCVSEVERRRYFERI